VKQVDAIEVFCSYTNTNADEVLCKELIKHLSALQREGLISLWHIRDVAAGTEWREAVDIHLNSAQLILLLLSPDFIASEYCSGFEAKRAMERHQQGDARVIPIILRPVHWEITPFRKLQPLPTNAVPISSWHTVDEALFDVVGGIQKTINELNTKFLSSSPLSTTSTSSSMSATLPTSVWSIPFQRNPFFTGREEILANLHKALNQTQTVAITQPRAISGLGGIGKTQTAIEYAYRYRNEYTAVLWIQSHTREELIADFLNAANLLNLAEKDVQDQSIVVNAVKGWLENHAGWLLIFDNADDLAMVRNYLPSLNRGHILLTTRVQTMSGLAHKIGLEKMELDEGALFLLRRAKNIIAHDSLLEQTSTAELEQAKEIVKVLDGLPLALDQAGAYIEETKCGLPAYLKISMTQQTKLLKRRGGIATDHPEPVTTTWSLSFEKVEKANQAAAELLRFCAFLSPDAIPEEIFIEGASELGPVLQSVATDPFELNTAIGELLRYSLISRDSNTQTLTVHRLVQAVLKDEMDKNLQKEWAERAVKALSDVVPTSKFETWHLFQRLLPHLQICASLIKQWNMKFSQATHLLHQTGAYLHDRTRYDEAKQLYLDALELREQILGPEHPEVATTLNNLALLYYNRGQYSQAESQFQRALEIKEKALGFEHPEVALTLNNLAVLYSSQGKYIQADSLFQRALSIQEKILDAKHPDLAITLNNLATLCRHQGRYAQAERLCQRALTIQEKALDPEHPDLATTLNNLATLYRDQGKDELAKPYYQRALTIREKVLGPEHPDLATTLNNLATLYRDPSEYELAKLHRERALVIHEKVLGPTHPKVAIDLNNLAALYYGQGQFTKAYQLYQQALTIQEEVLGPEHPDLATTLNNLGLFYRNQRQYHHAALHYKRALEIYERSLGTEHPKVAIALINYAVLLRKMQQDTEAIQLEVRARAILNKHKKENA